MTTPVPTPAAELPITSTPEVPAAPRRRPGARLKLRNTLVGWTFILPNFLGFGTITLIPVIMLFYISMTNTRAFGVGEFVGLDNFARLLRDGSFHTAFFNTFYYAAFHIPLTFVVALALAMLLNKKLRGVAFFRTAAFFPYVTSIVAIAQVWNLLFSPEFGPINQFLGLLGIENAPGWTTSTTWALPAIIIVSVWRDMGYFMLLFLAGLQTVPPELYEAARVDGANALQRFWNVTMPCLRPTTFFVVVMLTISSFKVFDIVLVMTGGGPGQSTLVLSQYIYQKGFAEFDRGYASAVSIVLFLVCITVTIIQFLWNKRRDV